MVYLDDAEARSLRRVSSAVGRSPVLSISPEEEAAGPGARSLRVLRLLAVHGLSQNHAAAAILLLLHSSESPCYTSLRGHEVLMSAKYSSAYNELIHGQNGA